MSKLITLNDVHEDDGLLNLLFQNELIVFEDVQGSKIWVNFDGDNIIIKPKTISSEPINLIDLAMQNYYNSAVKYFSTFDNRIKSLLNKKWWFGFEYFPDNIPGNIEYNRIPKNNLVLTCIYKGSKKFNFDVDEIFEYARLMNVDSIPVIYQGKLSYDTQEAIKYFLNTSEEDLEFVFGEKSFAFFFYKILNPQLSRSFLMEDDFQKNLEKIIIRVPEKDVSFEILNPLYRRISDINSTEFVEIYSLILINFLTFCQSINLETIKIKSTRKDEGYIKLISTLFNIYVNEVREDLLNFDFVIPKFFDKDKFKINRELITDKTTKEIIDEDPKLEYIYKIVLSSFSKERKKPIGVFTEETITIFNNFVNNISQYLDKSMKKYREIELAKRKLIDFGEFFDIEYDVDGDQKTYPDVYSEFERGIPDDKKKKKGKFVKGEIITKEDENKTDI